MTDAAIYNLIFQSLRRDVREEFLHRALVNGLVAAPLYGWKGDFPLENMIYHENMGRRSLHIELAEDCFDFPPACSFFHFFSRIGVDEEIDYLKVHLNRLPTSWDFLWQIRVIWFDTAKTEQDVDAFAASIGSE